MDPSNDPGALKDLINATLFAWGVPIALLVQLAKNLWANSVTGELPKWADVVLAFVALGASLFLVGAWHRYLPSDQVPSMLTDFWVQSFILWLAAFGSNFVLKSIYGAGRPPANANELRAYVSKADPVVVEKAGVAMTEVKPASSLSSGSGLGLLIALAAILTIGWAAAVYAQPSRTFTDATGTVVTEPDSSIFAMWRLGGSVSLQAAAIEVGADEEAGLEARRFSAFLPGAGLSYSWTDALQTTLNVEGVPASKAYFGSAGARLLTYQGEGDHGLQLGLGVDYVWANADARQMMGWANDKNLQLSIRTAVPAILRKDGSAGLYVVASARFTPDEKRSKPFYAVGLRPVLFGGH